MTEDAAVEETEIEAEAKIEESQDEEQVKEPSESSTENEELEESKETSGVQKRIDELTRNYREAQRERDYYKELANKQPEPIKIDETPKTLEDFEYDEQKYHAYMLDQAREYALKAVREEQGKETSNRTQQAFREREAAFAKDTEDYERYAHDVNLTITQPMAEIIREMDQGPAVLYHLGKNPDIADAISKLSPLAQARELGKMEANISIKPEKPVSQAPPPPPKIKAADPAIKIDPKSPESDKLSTAEWLKKRNKQVRG